MNFQKLKNFISIYIIFSVLISCSGGSGGGDDVSYPYNTPEEIEIFLDEIKLNYPAITSIEAMGQSQSGQYEIKALIISGNPTDPEGKPSIRLTGGIHGNEMMSVELLVRFIEYLTSNYGKDTTVTDIVNNRYICIIPVLNPDGLANNSRYNSRGVDLNRNFGEQWASGSSHGDSAFSESETQALRDFSLPKNFNISITYHVGSVLVNMPFDYGKESEGIAPTENDLVKEFAKTYTNAGTFLSNPDLYVSPYMHEGTINGGDWYIITGSLQDWSYVQTGCLDLTIEIARSNPDTEEDVQQVFLYNRDSLMAYIAKADSHVWH